LILSLSLAGIRAVALTAEALAGAGATGAAFTATVALLRNANNREEIKALRINEAPSI
jgi:ABC-type transporter Mla maintaining outer membrane lipid asymmetry permease subunit MlaE